METLDSSFLVIKKYTTLRELLLSGWEHKAIISSVYKRKEREEVWAN